MFGKKDAIFMAQAIQLAAKGRYTTDPNPRVGCIFVNDNKILGKGWHERAGEGHAEIIALNNAKNISGATAYVTLEPCSHHGRTPPCSDTLIDAGIKRVVVAMQDPNPMVAGKGLQRLREAGVEVECGLLEQDTRALNPGFIKRMETGKPWVISKMAMSLDGRTAMASGESKWITSTESRQDVHRLRAESSAILTGINTVLADDPSMNARLADVDVVQPLRVILDSKLRMPLTAQMATVPGRTLVLTCVKDKQRQEVITQAGFEVYSLPAHQGQVDLKEVMIFLGQQQINQVLVEAGATLNGALLQQNLVDEWLVYMAPCILGSEGRGLFNLSEMHSMADKKNLRITNMRQIGSDIRIRFVAN
jgi:diaminohydroxyphosphoribosylaminopyrimidine deaminase/5-amino-6-(5-phosphoribosylamino)uracil reductase